ncbi:hypothetical protein GWO43_21050 [candidate division KSB1 bacterium]|nr:hypothetical protein [candidate division KSB1 bacterium]NIR70283.1 hypothetical protein [candidate division KSB1 bacterium]NIS26553.1 hypothetical protein [candidate division KSB1 bacterium]NIT73316.1 hypothetical protein [candidate division KSB1 bacterium]NIU23939.1 hypothetical protein [candidate division KSB1 bacterium]
MEVEEIRKLMTVRPFKPIEVHLDNGETFVINHPEVIVHRVLITAVDNKGELVYIAPEAISAIKPANNTE